MADKWLHCNPTSEEDKLEARQMVYNLYNKKEASGVQTNKIIGDIARELGLSRFVTQCCYNYEKDRLDPQVNYIKLIFCAIYLFFYYF